MSHSTSDPKRGWHFGLDDHDYVALVQCERTGDGPLDWRASELVQYVQVAKLRRAWEADLTKTERPKGPGEGFEVFVTWPAAVAYDERTL